MIGLADNNDPVRNGREAGGAARSVGPFRIVATCVAAAVGFGLFAGVAPMTSMLARAEAPFSRDLLHVVTDTGRFALDIEVAETEAQKRLGLMFRTTIAAGRGMLFPYAPAQEITMWMRNTYVSLDMVFIRADGVVHRVETGTEPMSEAIIASRGDVSAVLEIAAGEAKRLGIRAGSRVEHPLFGPR